MAPVNAPLPLPPHPASPLIPVLLTVTARLEPRELVLHYRVRGDTAAVRWPTAEGGGAADGLWQHTCFEAFIGTIGQAAYDEFNFSPSGRWAHYAFSHERERTTDPVHAPPPLIDLQRTAEGIDLVAVLDRHALPPAPWDIGLCAVVEGLQGQVAHRALRHPRDKPDFHHRAGWTLHLPAD